MGKGEREPLSRSENISEETISGDNQPVSKSFQLFSKKGSSSRKDAAYSRRTCGSASKPLTAEMRRCQKQKIIASKKSSGKVENSCKRKVRTKTIVDDRKRLKKGCNESLDKVHRYVVEPSEEFCARVATNFDPYVATFLKKCLRPSALELLRETCFGFVLDVDTIVSQPQIIHGIVLHEVYSIDDQAMFYKIGSKVVRFGIEEFALVSGLKCVGDKHMADNLKWDGGFMSTYFPGTDDVKKQSLVYAIEYGRAKNDEDAVKFAVLYIIHRFVNVRRTEYKLVKKDFDIVDSGFYNRFPWGLVSFGAMKDSVHGIFRIHQNRTEKFRYRINGCPAAFQVWLYETCSVTVDSVATRLEGDVRFPRLLNWKAERSPTTEEVNRWIFNNVEVKVQNLVLNSNKPQPVVEEISVSGRDQKMKQFISLKAYIDEQVSPLRSSVDGYIAKVNKRIDEIGKDDVLRKRFSPGDGDNLFYGDGTDDDQDRGEDEQHSQGCDVVEEAEVNKEIPQSEKIDVVQDSVQNVIGAAEDGGEDVQVENAAVEAGDFELSQNQLDSQIPFLQYARRSDNTRSDSRVEMISNTFGDSRVIFSVTNGAFEVSNSRPKISDVSSLTPNTEGFSAENVPKAGEDISNRMILMEEDSLAFAIEVERPEESDCHLTQTFSFGLSHMANICGLDSVKDEVESPADGAVEGYRVKKELECVLRSIMETYGDIAAKFILESQKNRSSVLEDICEIVQILQRKRLTELPEEEIESLLSQVYDLGKAGMKVEWLQERLESMLDAKCQLKQIPALKKRRDRNDVVLRELKTNLKRYEAQCNELKEKRDKDAEHITELKRNLDYYDAEIEKLQKCANSTKEDLETEKGEAETIKQIVSHAGSKVRSFVEHSLLDGLLYLNDSSA